VSSFIVEGRTTLSGAFRVNGNKNEALPAIAAAMLSRETVTLTNMPDIGDIRNMLAIATQLGAQVTEVKNGTATITARKIATSTLPTDLAGAIRGSILFASALLVRTGKAVIIQPGGDAIGRRRVDTHFLVLQALGAKLTTKRVHQAQHHQTIFQLSAPKGLKGTDIFLDEASVTATENALIAAAGATGTTHIVNAASEPHVQGLCRMLVRMGAHIDGIGSNVLSVHGAPDFAPLTHELGSDYIEAGSLVGLAAATRSPLTITNVDTQVMRMILFQFSRLGIVTQVDHQKRTIVVPAAKHLSIRRDLGGVIPKIDSNPWPGFPADLTSIALVAATQSRGTCLIHEKMFESRLFFVDKLIAMGAQIVLCDPHRAVIVGPTPLYGASMSSPDIRAGMAILIAALAAEGRSVIQNIEQIDRGYQDIDGRLNALGARIRRQQDRRKSPG
jgi:UDP-N-acetylglucosamine 1-carboxyvinyltransferase